MYWVHYMSVLKRRSWEDNSMAKWFIGTAWEF